MEFSKPGAIRQCTGQTPVRHTLYDGPLEKYQGRTLEESVPYCLYRKYVNAAGHVVRVVIDPAATRRDPLNDYSVKTQEWRKSRGQVPYDVCPVGKTDLPEFAKESPCMKHDAAQAEREGAMRRYRAAVKRAQESGIPLAVAPPTDLAEDHCCKHIKQLILMRRERHDRASESFADRSKSAMQRQFEGQQRFMEQAAGYFAAKDEDGGSVRTESK